MTVLQRARQNNYGCMVLSQLACWLLKLILPHGYRDGTNWTLFKKTWPIQGMYTTAAALSVNAEGAALTYGIVFAAGSLPTSK